jgi:O-methyltransferase involved in polyketide biosynthesis
LHESPDTSRISFTALYTGQVWQRHGLGDPVLESLPARVLHALLIPLNATGGWLRQGFDLETVLLQRHKLIDHFLEEAIAAHGVRQVVEVAAGLSPRGIRFRKRHRAHGLRYVEVDLPGMAARKRERLRAGGYLGPEHVVVAGNALATGGSGSLPEIFREHVDLSAPAAIVSEGLVNYFPIEDLRIIWGGFREALELCPHGIYLSDITFDLRRDRYARVIGVLKAVLELAVRGRTHLHFADARECVAELAAVGFRESAVFDPREFEDALGLPASEGEALVRVLRAETRSCP